MGLLPTGEYSKEELHLQGITGAPQRHPVHFAFWGVNAASFGYLVARHPSGDNSMFAPGLAAPLHTRAFNSRKKCDYGTACLCAVMSRGAIVKET
mmetsp:Transcript_38000/g.61888  ORF Transcript_38000/g.61888 Transcript_38000/m.61888 type:complete len:95 (+) Transcript_38000:1390-1674(+)